MKLKIAFITLCLSVAGAAMAAPHASAYADVGTKPYGDDAGDRIDTYMTGFHSGEYADWRNQNWVTFKYNDDSWIFAAWTDDDAAITSAAAITDGGGFYTAISGHVFCRFYNTSGAVGCNPWASSSFTTDTIFDMHLSDSGKADNPDIVAQYSELLVNFEGNISYDIKDKLAKFTIHDIGASAVKCQLFIDDNPAVDNDAGPDEFIYTFGSCKDGESITHAWDKHGTYYVRLEVTDGDDNVIQVTKIFNIDGRSFSGGFSSTENNDEGEGEDVSLDPKDALANCFKEAFPFIDIEGCIENLTGITSMLTFNAINFGSQWSVNPCRNLTVVDEWMHLSSPEICPQVPSTVRNIVTPFVTCALGLMMVAFITRQTRERF